MLTITGLKTEYRENPLGIDAPAPRLGWRLKSDGQNVLQAAYRVTATDGNGAPLWDSGRVEDAAQRVAWRGPALQSRQRVSWQVRVWANTGEQAQSAPAAFEMGLLVESDWWAKWVEPEDEVDFEALKPPPYLRRVFNVAKPVKAARIYQTAHGLYRFWLNGAEGTGDLFNPGFTSYHKRLQYQVYDVAALLAPGENVWAVVLGDGWWRGLTGGAVKNNFGDKLAFLGQLEIEYEDGTRETVVTDDSFRTATGGLLYADMQRGECYDPSLEPAGWRLPGFDDTGWRNVHTIPVGCGNLVATRSLPMRAMERFEGKLLHTPDGSRVLDFGQNIAGQVMVRLRGGQRGRRVVLHHGETLDSDGNFTLANIHAMNFSMDLFQQLTYVMRGEGEESYQGMFLISGFRYVKLEGYDGEILPGDFTAVAIYTALEETGRFTCSNPLINRLVENSRWSQKGNFLDVPTDCPTRERSPWTGDAQLYSKTAASFMNVYPFFEKWLADLAAEQQPDGRVASTVPSTQAVHNQNETDRFYARHAGLNPDGSQREVQMFDPVTVEQGLMIDGAAGWADAAAIVPYNMYLCYGDEQILENQYESAKKWVEYALRHAADADPNYAGNAYYQNPEDARWVWDTCFHFGEWLEAGVEHVPGQDGDPLKTPDYRVATAYLYHSLRLVARMAGVLGRAGEEAKYTAAADEVKRVYNQYLIPEDGVLVQGRQAPNLRVLALDICDDAHRKAVAEGLARMVAGQGYHLNTGFLSTPFLLGTLVDHGYADIAFKVLEQETAPSWLYNVKRGATTIPEGWDSLDRLHGSFNHYSYGAVCDFLFSYVAGIRPDAEAPGYRHFTLAPVTGGSLTEATAEYQSPYGTIQSAWKVRGDTVEYSFTVPPGTTADIRLPDGVARTVGSGRYVYEIQADSKTKRRTV